MIKYIKSYSFIKRWKLSNNFAFSVSKPLVGCQFEKLPDVTPSPELRRDHIACVRGDEMFVYGGRDETDNLLIEDIWVYNIKTSSWKQHKTKNVAPNCVQGSTAWFNDNHMFLFGGGHREVSNDVHSLDLDTWEWTQHPTSGNKPSGRRHHVLWTITNNIIVFGGYGKGGYTNDTFHLNTHSMKWTELTTTGTPPSPRAVCAYAQCAGKGFVFGGKGDIYNNDLHMLDLTSHVWTKLQPISSSHPPVRHSSRMIVRDTDLIICGGYGDGHKFFSDCWVWEIENKMWRELKDHDFDERSSHTACYMSDDDSVLIFGGSNYVAVGSLGRMSFV